MNADRLLALYDRVADASDAVDRLRRFVLDLAVRGKLVEQDPADEPASELLKRIAAEKARSVKAGKLRRRKVPSRLDEPLFSLPGNWHWARIREVVSDRGHKVPDRPFTYIDVSAIDKKAGLVADPRVLEPSNAPSRARKVARPGDVVYSCVRPYLLNVAIIEGDFDPPPIASTAFEVLNGHGLVLPRYIWMVLRSPFMIACVEQSQRGQAYPAINSTDFAVLPFPLPPLAEQRRIVAKVDELMALCDRLEATRTAREDTRDRLTIASLTRLTASGTDVPTFRSHARFAVDALPAMTARADQVKHLRQTILNLAVRGKLVEQDPADEPALELLNRIEAEKARLVEAREIRKPMRMPVLDTNELPFNPPHGWAWTRLFEISRKIHYGFTASANRMVEAVRLLRITDIQDNSVDWLSVPGCEIEENVLPKFRLERGDVLIARTGGTIGKSFLVQDVPVTAVFASYLIRIQGSHEVYDRYLKFFLESPAYWTQLRDGARGAGQPNVNGQTLGRMAVPVPPLAEQHRIVSRVDDLLALCDRLENGLGAADGTRGRLLESLLHDALKTHEAATTGRVQEVTRIGA